MTEDKAREKKCPLLILAASIYGTTYCIATQCMMWRTSQEPLSEKLAREAQIPLRAATKFGYCGLAGKDELYLGSR